MNKKPGAFWTISEVADDLDLPQHVLRFWETRFPHIKPLKSAGGRRYYRPQDVDLIRGIRALLYDEGYTIKGVLRILKEKGVRAVQDFNLDSDNDDPGLEFESDTSSIDDDVSYDEADQQVFSISPQPVSHHAQEPDPFHPPLRVKPSFQNYDNIDLFSEGIPLKSKGSSKANLGSMGHNLNRADAIDPPYGGSPPPLEQSKLPRDHLSPAQIKKLMFVREELLECRRLLKQGNTIIDQTTEDE